MSNKPAQRCHVCYCLWQEVLCTILQKRQSLLKIFLTEIKGGGGYSFLTHITDGEQWQAQYLRCKDPSAQVHEALYIELALPSPFLTVQHQWTKQWLSTSVTFHTVKRYPTWLQPALPSKNKQGNPTLSEAQDSLVPSQHFQSFPPWHTTTFMQLPDGRQRASPHSVLPHRRMWSYNGELSLEKTLKPVGTECHHTSSSHQSLRLGCGIQRIFSFFLTRELAGHEDELHTAGTWTRPRGTPCPCRQCS